VRRPSTILLIEPDDALLYLMERYSCRGRHRLAVRKLEGGVDALWQLRPAVMWFPSLQSLEASMPRQRGRVGEDVPVIVCTSKGDEMRARELGADHCALHPLTFAEFTGALAAVGVPRPA
jgi:hypothetical protein